MAPVQTAQIASTSGIDRLGGRFQSILPLRKVITRNCHACYDDPVENRTEPKTVMQWIRYVGMAAIALILVWEMLRIYVL